ncbi:MAG: hypothetical protein JW951_08220, partial [Lentisphaerae bacterium]|nr:hypothetical protein [Lentisphaerota bacterium]
MSVTRHFLGRREPTAATVARFLLPDSPDGSVDLGNRLVIVPTRQAGRRLREALARACADRGGALLSPRVVTPAVLLADDTARPRPAPPAVVKAVWARTLAAADLERCTGLFPHGAPARDFAWALRTGDMLQDLRRTLAEGGYSMAAVTEQHRADLEEPERWRDLAALETRYLENLHGLSFEDPVRHALDAARRPRLPEGTTGVVLAAVPDPVPLALRALDAVSAALPVDVLIAAPAAEAKRFDAWGRPVPAAWADAPLPVPDPDANILLAASPAGQAERVIAEIAAERQRFGPADVAIGVADPSVSPFLRAALEDNGLPPFDPADVPFRDHPLCQLVTAWADLLTAPTYAAFAAFLRQPPVLEYLEDRDGVDPAGLLTELDTFQNRHLPLEFEDITAHLNDAFPALSAAAALVSDQLGAPGGDGPVAALRRFLQTVYRSRTLNTGQPEDDAFTRAAAVLNSTLREWSLPEDTAPELAPRDVLALLMRRLAEQAIRPERGDEPVDLEGWLELPWNDAPFLIVTGMNEGAVPAARCADAFLPDSLRTRLGLPDNAARYARDAFLMQGLTATRRHAGRVCFITGKAGASGDPLQPSRLLLRGTDSELAARVRRLFAPAPAAPYPPPAGPGLQLDPRVPPPPPPPPHT